jgi:hypothetical protein
MIRVLMVLPLLVLGCASTKLYAPNGKIIANMQGDYTRLKFASSGPGYSVSFEANTALHSTVTRAQGEAAHSVLGGVSTLATSVGAAVATSGIVPAVK